MKTLKNTPIFKNKDMGFCSCTKVKTSLHKLTAAEVEFKLSRKKIFQQRELIYTDLPRESGRLSMTV